MGDGDGARDEGEEVAPGSITHFTPVTALDFSLHLGDIYIDGFQHLSIGDTAG